MSNHIDEGYHATAKAAGLLCKAPKVASHLRTGFRYIEAVVKNCFAVCQISRSGQEVLQDSLRCVIGVDVVKVKRLITPTQPRARTIARKGRECHVRAEVSLVLPNQGKVRKGRAGNVLCKRSASQTQQARQTDGNQRHPERVQQLETRSRSRLCRGVSFRCRLGFNDTQVPGRWRSWSDLAFQVMTHIYRARDQAHPVTRSTSE